MKRFVAVVAIAGAAIFFAAPPADDGRTTDTPGAQTRPAVERRHQPRAERPALPAPEPAQTSSDAHARIDPPIVVTSAADDGDDLITDSMEVALAEAAYIERQRQRHITPPVVEDTYEDPELYSVERAREAEERLEPGYRGPDIELR